MNQIHGKAPVYPDATSERPRQRRLRPIRAALLAFAVTAATLGALTAAPAMAKFGVVSFSNTVTNQDGSTTTQAGSHPYEMTASMTFTQRSSGLPTENVKDVQVNLPPGLIGNANATPKCTVEDLDNMQCPGDSQVGQLIITYNSGSGNSVLPEGLYNLVPPAGKPAQFGANVIVVNSFLDVSVRTGGNYGLTTTSSNISAGLPIVGITVALWGVPADPATTPSGCATTRRLTPASRRARAVPRRRRF